MKYSIYLDNNATTPLDPRVFDAMLPILKEHFGNPASVSHEYGWYAGELVEVARERLARTISASPEEIIFTSGATESINLALQGAIHHSISTKKNIKPHVITAGTEHKATLDTLRLLAERGEIQLTETGLSKTGEISLIDIELAFKPNTVLVSLLLANNEIGTLHPIHDFSKLTRLRGALLHCDATQAIGKLPVSVETLGVDLLSLSAHKIYGPKGIGALYLRKSTTEKKISPLLHGGGHEHGLRSGTLNVPGIVGLGVAAELAEKERATVSGQLRELSKKFLEILSAAGAKFELNGPPLENRLPGNLNLYFPKTTSARLLSSLQGKVACSSSAACSSAAGRSSHVLSALGFTTERIQSSIRIGIGRFNTASEIQKAGDLIAELVQT